VIRPGGTNHRAGRCGAFAGSNGDRSSRQRGWLWPLVAAEIATRWTCAEFRAEEPNLEDDVRHCKVAVLLPDGRRLLAANENGTVVTLDATTGKILRRVDSSKVDLTAVPWIALAAFLLWGIAWFCAGDRRYMWAGGSDSDKRWHWRLCLLVLFASGYAVGGAMFLYAMLIAPIEQVRIDDGVDCLVAVSVIGCILLLGTVVLFHRKRRLDRLF